MGKLRRPGQTDAGLASGAISMGLLLFLAACGSQPEPAGNAVAVPDAPANEALGNVAGEPAPANVTEPEAQPTPAATATPTAAATPAATEPAPAAPVETAAGGDAANGAKLYAQCKICHALEPGKHGLGPSLHGVVGRKAAALPDFNYSPAMKASGKVWTNAALSDYLRAPMKVVPGTKMAFAGVANDKSRADIIAYLDTLK